ncbi:MAG: hypothetical protein JNL82_23660 [Myxococcales bacterium]|nr:hypothetical protein [Myxococcales bacterium]
MSLESLRIREPCHADWATMDGDQRSRHCAQCDLRVTDLSQLTRAEAEALIAARAPGGRLCVRYTVDDAGQVVTRTTRQARLVTLLRSLAARGAS